MSLVLTGKFGGPPGFPGKQSLNNGQTNAKMGMPQKYAGADGGGSFAAGRSAFLSRPVNAFRLTDLNNQMSGWSKTQVSHNGRTIGVSNGKSNYIVSADQHIQRKKNNAIGRGSTKANLPSDAPMSFGNKDNTIKNSALSRVRGGGCVAPAKKGAIANTFKSAGH